MRALRRAQGTSGGVLDRVVVIGAGAVGSHMVASLREGVSCLVVERNAAVRQALEATGVPTVGPEDVARVLRTGDVVVLATSAAAAEAAGRAVPAWAPLVSLTNGVTPGLAPGRTVSYGVVEFAVSCPSPGRAACAQRGWLTLEKDGERGGAAWLAAAIDPRRQRVRLTEDIDPHRKGKLMLNASLDPVAALIGGTIGDVFARRCSLWAFRGLLEEALEVARASRWRLAAVQGMRPDRLARILAAPGVGALAAWAAARRARAVASTLSREVAGGAIGEADHLCGAIARQGASVAVATPLHERAMVLLRRAAAEGGGRRSLAAELRP